MSQVYEAGANISANGVGNFRVHRSHDISNYREVAIVRASALYLKVSKMGALGTPHNMRTKLLGAQYA